jgi:hypothetical protein
MVMVLATSKMKTILMNNLLSKMQMPPIDRKIHQLHKILLIEQIPISKTKKATKIKIFLKILMTKKDILKVQIKKAKL